MKFLTKTLPLAIIAAAILQACGNQDEASSGIAFVKIGQAGPLTGPQAHVGKDNENGVRMAVDEANEKGVVLGGQKVKFVLFTEDDQADPKQGTVVAQKLVDGKMAGVVGHLNSGTTIPASRIYAEADIPQISPSATNPKYTQQGYKTAFRVMANDVQQGKVLGMFAVSRLGAKNIALIDDRTAYGQGLADEFVKAVEEAGGHIVLREFTTDKASDFSAILTRVKYRNPDLVFYGGMDTQAGPMARQLKSLGLTVPLLFGDGGCTTEFSKLAGEAAEGHYCSLPGVPLEQMSGGAQFKERFKAKFNVDIQLYAPYAYDAANILIEAIKKADSADPGRYMPYLVRTDHQGVTGRIVFDAKGDLLNGNITVYQSRGGKWVPKETMAAGQPAQSGGQASNPSKDLGAALEKAADTVTENKSPVVDAVKSAEESAKIPGQKF